MQSSIDGVLAAEERAHIAALLYRYPANTPEELAELRTWFSRVATPLDFGLLAADPQVADQYRAYRKDHHDRMKPRDIGMAALFVSAAIAVVGGVVLAIP